MFSSFSPSMEVATLNACFLFQVLTFFYQHLANCNWIFLDLHHIIPWLVALLSFDCSIDHERNYWLCLMLFIVIYRCFYHENSSRVSFFPAFCILAIDLLDLPPSDLFPCCSNFLLAHEPLSLTGQSWHIGNVSRFLKQLIWWQALHRNLRCWLDFVGVGCIKAWVFGIVGRSFWYSTNGYYSFWCATYFWWQWRWTTIFG